MVVAVDTIPGHVETILATYTIINLFLTLVVLLMATLTRWDTKVFVTGVCTCDRDYVNPTPSPTTSDEEDASIESESENPEEEEPTSPQEN